MSGNGKAFEPTAEELGIYVHWQKCSDTQPRSASVREAHLKRIRARLRDGFTPEQLMLVAEVAAWEPFYLEQGYHKQPEIFWRNAARVDRLLGVWERERNRPIPL